MGHELASSDTLFVIPSHVVDTVFYAIEENGDGRPFRFSAGTTSYLRTVHPILFDYVDKKKFGCPTQNTYELAFAIAFNVVAGRLEEEGITIELQEADIEKLKRLRAKVFSDRIFRSRKKVVEAIGSNVLERPNTPFCNFLNILDYSSPELSDKLHFYATEMNEADILKSLVEGFYDGFMVFYQRVL